MCVKSIFKALGGLFGAGAMPKAEPLPTPPEAPKDVDPSVQKARADTRRRAAQAKGFKSTLIGSAQPLADPLLSSTTLIGGAGNLQL